MMWSNVQTGFRYDSVLQVDSRAPTPIGRAARIFTPPPHALQLDQEMHDAQLARLTTLLQFRPPQALPPLELMRMLCCSSEELHRSTAPPLPEPPPGREVHDADLAIVARLRGPRPPDGPPPDHLMQKLCCPLLDQRRSSTPPQLAPQPEVENHNAQLAMLARLRGPRQPDKPPPVYLMLAYRSGEAHHGSYMQKGCAAKQEREQEEEQIEKQEEEQEEGQAQTTSMTSQIIWMISQTLPALANDMFNIEAHYANNEDMPNDFAWRIMVSGVAMSSVVDVMNQAVGSLFSCRPPTGTGAAEHRRLIRNAWEELFRMRRLVELNDFAPINNTKTLAHIHNLWCDKWLIDNLAEEQLQKTDSQQTSIFSAWMRRNYGSKRFVMAILETGMSWATMSGAAEHIGTVCDANEHGIAIVGPQQTMTKFIDWIVQVVKAIDMHKNEPSVKKKRNEAYNRVIRRFKAKGEYNLPKAKDRAGVRYKPRSTMTKRFRITDYS